MLQMGEHQSPKTETGTETETDTAAAAAAATATAATTATAAAADDAVNNTNLEESTERTSISANHNHNHSNDAATATLNVNVNDARTADTSRSTPHSTPHSRPPVAKDKRCIYCHMAFTSSALGRHYDQFLFKKKPDGVHNVDEICQMRSNITRRTARTSSAAAELTKQEPASAFSNASVSDAGSVRSARPAQSLPPAGAPAASASAASAASATAAGPDGMVSVADQHRQSVGSGRPSGVGAYQVYYNPSPFTSTSPPVNHNNHINNNNSSLNSPVPPKLPQTDTNSKTHTMRAMELALREVLDSIKAATTRVHARVLPFDFELNTQTYPSLCLNALQPPPTIFSPGPFPSDTSFSIDPPTAALKERVQTALRERVDKWKHDQHHLLNATSDKSTPQHLIKLNAEQDLIERQARQHEEMVLKHLDLALKSWETRSPEQQQEMWHLEIMRALAHERGKRRDLEAQLDRAHQESDRLRLHLEKANSFHFPREHSFPWNERKHSTIHFDQSD
ncbi:Arp complex subunit [Ascosphaera pollenicola]|nr:Arp complex subunit [Ascosphaera pollenicola]